MEGDIHFPWLGDWETVAELIEDFVLAREPKRVRPLTRSVPRPERERPLHRLVHYRVGDAPERPSYRIAVAQIGEPADLPLPGPSGAYRLPEARVEDVARKLTVYVERAAERGAALVVFPEMSIDLNHALLEERAHALAREHGVLLVCGGYHDEITRANVCTVLGPDGVLWQQRKHIPALLRAGDTWVEEPIETPASPLYVIGATHLGRIAIAVCRDFLDLELRVALKNSEPPADLVLNPAFTPVTADFGAAHFEARRALYSCTVFVNFAVFGDSRVESPDKDARRVHVGPGEERLELVEVPLFALRAQRGAWDAQARRRFLQSTRR